MTNDKAKINEKIGDWFMDVAKYIATAILVTSFLGEFRQKWVIYVIGLLLVTTFFYYGIRILSKK